MKLTPDGKKSVEAALRDRAWRLEDLAAKSQLSIATVKRFSARSPIGTSSFISLCESLGLEWDTVSGQRKSQLDSEQDKNSKSLTFSNPFMQRGMLDRLEDIYGRDRELRAIFEFLNSGTSVALIGQSGIGSSSMLRAVELQAPQQLPKRKPIYLNMREIWNAEEYYAILADEIGINNDTRFQLQRELKDKRVLLLLDGTEQLTQEWFTEGMRNQLRAWANAGARSPLRLVVAAHRPLTELFEDSGMDSPFANICHELQLQPWDAATVQGFIEDRLAGTGVQFTEEETEEIIAKSGGIPSQVMVLCYEYYEGYRD